MELEIATPCISEGCRSGSTLPGWSKTGRRTRTTRARHQMQQQGPAAVASDDEAHEFTILESDEFVIESLPPKKRKLQPCCEVPPAKDKRHHRCNICGRSFSSYQALGGHKAHHNSNDQKAAMATLTGEDGDAVVRCCEPPGRSSGEHRCTFCYKVFSKGQALGGHRRHCQRPMAENQEKMFSFDLNELPPDWLES